MTRCKFHIYPIYIDPLHQASTGLMGARCTVHNMDVGQTPMTAGYICPIGQIEEATDKAVERVYDAVGEVVRAMASIRDE